jgi:hypothetical protein
MIDRFTLQGADRAKVGGVLISAPVVIAVVLAARSVAMTRPASLGWVLATAVFVGGLNLAGIYALLTAAPMKRSWELRFAIVLFAAALTLFTVLTVTARGSAAVLMTGIATATLLIGAQVWTAVRLGKAEARSSSEAVPPEAAVAVPPEPLQEVVSLLPPGTDQTWRRWTEEGHEHLEGCVRVKFLPGQATVTVHIPLQPAMSATPRVEFEPIDDVDLRISADPVLPYGVRLVCRRSAPLDAELDTGVSVAISADPSVARAA